MNFIIWILQKSPRNKITFPALIWKNNYWKKEVTVSESTVN